jgi:hypothetical protein
VLAPQRAECRATASFDVSVALTGVPWRFVQASYWVCLLSAILCFHQHGRFVFAFLKSANPACGGCLRILFALFCIAGPCFSLCILIDQMSSLHQSRQFVNGKKQLPGWVQGWGRGGISWKR